MAEKKLPTIGEKYSQEDKWMLYDDPASLPDQEGRVASAERANFPRYKKNGWTPEFAFPKEPTMRAEYRQYLRDNE